MKNILQKKSSDIHLKDKEENVSIKNEKNSTKNGEEVENFIQNTTDPNTEDSREDTNAVTDNEMYQEINTNNTQEEFPLNKDDEVFRLKEELLRLHADIDNTKKRLTRLFEDRVRDKTVAILMDIIEHIDNFERAFDSHKQMRIDNNEAKQGMNTNAIFDGFGMIKNQLLSTLQNNWGLNSMEALHKEFNPDEHEAIMQENSETVEYPTVVQEFVKGYTYLGKVIRPAKVKVALPKGKN